MLWLGEGEWRCGTGCEKVNKPRIVLVVLGALRRYYRCLGGMVWW